MAATLKSPIEWIGNFVIEGIEELGQMAVMTVQAVTWLVRPPFRITVFFEALYSFGVGSLFIVLFTALFSGLVMALQFYTGFKEFNAETMVGGTVAISLARELSPVLAGLMVAGRTGSAMTTEIGTMRVTEQIDAMSVMAVNPVQYLVAPRVFAAVTMMPVLVTIFNFVGIVAAYALCVYHLGIDPGMFIGYAKDFVDGQDLFYSALKGACFGMAIAVVACYKGFYASGGAKGVGEATTQSVVTASVAILFIDYWLTTILW